MIDGFQLIERIRGHHNPLVRRMPAAALTAYARSEDRVKALRAGFQIHLAKPIDPSELVTAVEALANRFALNQPRMKTLSMEKPKILTSKELRAIMPRLSGWKLAHNKLSRTFEFQDFVASLSFINSLVAYSGRMDHRSRMCRSPTAR